MAVITRAERMTIKDRLMAIGSANLALVFGDVTGEDAVWTLSQPVAVVVVHLIGRLNEESSMATAACDALVKMTPNADENSALKAIADRLREQTAQATANPVQELWIGAEPMVDRSGLRALLTEIANGYHHGVIYIAGGPMSGRSHSFQLIRHVARSQNVQLHKVDFTLETESRTLGHLYGGLKQAYAIGAADEPTHEGATPGDVAAKFAAYLRAHLAAAPLILPKPWLVIDFSDEVPDPAVPEFIKMFCADRDANQFDNCVVFVLGPTAHRDSMRSDLPNMQVEDLGQVTQTEVFEVASALNERGRQPLGTAALSARATNIYDAVIHLPDDARFPELRRKLLELRAEVRAP